MSTIQDTALLESLNAGLEPASTPSPGELNQEDFLTILVAQLMNQDPISPMDSQAFLGQLAQFSTVGGIQDLQQSVDQLSQSEQAFQVFQASNLVGRSVMIASDQGYLAADQPLRGGVNLTESVNDLTIIVSDASGQEVQRLSLGNQPAGYAEFTWDGKDSNGVQAAAGVYQIRAEGTVNGEVYPFDTQVQATVQSVSLGPAGDITLNLVGLGGHDISEVQEIL